MGKQCEHGVFSWRYCGRCAEYIPDLQTQTNPVGVKTNKRAMRILEDLTPNGSEYVGDPERCAEYIRDLIDSKHRMIVKLMKEKREREKKDQDSGTAHAVNATRLLEGKLLEILSLSVQPPGGYSHMEAEEALLTIRATVRQALDSLSALSAQPSPRFLPTSPEANAIVDNLLAKQRAKETYSPLPSPQGEALDLGWIIRSLEYLLRPLEGDDTGIVRLIGLRDFVNKLAVLQARAGGG